MNTEPQSVFRLNSFARRLVDDGVLDIDAAQKACTDASDARRTLLAHLTLEKLADPAVLAATASTEFGVPLVDIQAFDLTQIPASVVKEQLINKHQALPLFLRGSQLFIAIADPTNHSAMEEIAFNSGFSVQPIIVDAASLAQAIEKALEAADAGFDEFEDEEGLEEVDFSLDDIQQDKDQGQVDAQVDDTPVVRFINKVLLDAIRKNASDIHFEPYENKYRIRYRLDGVLSRVASPPIQMSRRMSSRLKVMSGLDIAERRVPQDGRIKLNLSRNKSIDFRVSTCPTLWGEKVVLRILDSTATRLGVDKLGFEEKQRDLFTEAIVKPYGMILVTGPTGSGKTVTLYTALNILNEEGRNISTVEDPVEIRVQGINQVQQNTRQGMTFARALRAFLRQDPDIIMVGEIRDLETAEIAVKAAQTGHLVLSTLHTNDAPQSITRLMNMGIPSYNITSAVNLVMAQRLIRRLHTCKIADELPEEALLEAGFVEDDLDGLEVFKPNGCSGCNEGYKGRVGIFEVLPITDSIARIILEDGNSLQIREHARQEGFNDLRRSALNKVSDGVTGLMEINRVTKD